MGADRQPVRRAPVAAEGRGRGGDRARPAGPVAAAPADDADHRPVAAFRPGVRADLAAFPRAPRPAGGRLRPGVVQADHRDMGPVVRYLGPEVPAETLIWQDPVPAVDHELVDASDIAALKSQVLASGLSVSQLVSTAWAAASSFRGSDKRGGANGGRIRLEPQNGWEVNNPDELATALRALTGIQQSFSAGAKKISLADLVVLAGGAGVEQAARNAGFDVEVPFTPGRTDASQEHTDEESFAALEPKADGFRNYLGKGNRLPAEYLLLDKANLLTLSAPEMTVLVGGLRVLGANYEQSPLGAFTTTPGSLTNDFFVNLLDIGTTWQPTAKDANAFEGRDAATNEVKW